MCDVKYFVSCGCRLLSEIGCMPLIFFSFYSQHNLSVIRDTVHSDFVQLGLNEEFEGTPAEVLDVCIYVCV